ncbi:MAG: hypothetical protein WC451_03090 [Patescibacteria group bacterium]|jgi:predicted nuclease of restriction endonuclease-like RecB superfamily
MTDKMGFEGSRRICKQYNNKRIRLTIGGKTYDYRSLKEGKLAGFFELLKKSKQIKDWFYERGELPFTDSSYLPDFEIIENDDSKTYYEFKGFVEPSTKRKITLLRKYYPDIRYIMIMADKRGIKKLGSRATAKCNRVCTIQEFIGSLY